jgi:hypothetical protein
MKIHYLRAKFERLHVCKVSTMCACTCGIAVAFGFLCSAWQQSEGNKDHFFTMAKRVSPGAVIDLTLDSDDEKESRLGDIKKNLYSNKKFKAGPTRNAAIDNDVVIIDAPALKMAADAPAGNIGADDDLEEVVGTSRNEYRLLLVLASTTSPTAL